MCVLSAGPKAYIVAGATVLLAGPKARLSLKMAKYSKPALKYCQSRPYTGSYEMLAGPKVKLDHRVSALRAFRAFRLKGSQVVYLSLPYYII